MKAEVKEGKLVHIQGDEGNPDSQGFLCVRGRAAEEIIGNDQRLLYPLARESRESQDWRRVSWDDVLDRIANTMANAGGNRVGIWPGHGNGSNDYAVGVKSQLINRFAKMFGAQSWNPTMICWGLGGFGLGLTGVLETSTKEDMGENADLGIGNSEGSTRDWTFTKNAGNYSSKRLRIYVRPTTRPQ